MTTLLSSCNSHQSTGDSFDVSGMDTTVDFRNDFDNYVNGNWKLNNPVPADKGRYGTFDKLRDDTELQLQSLFNKITTTTHEYGSNGQKIADFYNLGMDTVTIEALGAKPMMPYLEAVDSIKTAADVCRFIAKSHASGTAMLFGFYGTPDSKNSNWVIATLRQGGLGLPDRDYYMGEDSHSKEILSKYQIFVADMLELSGDDSVEAAEKAAKILTFETRLAQHSMTRLECRDPQKTYFKVDLAGLDKISPNFDWDMFLAENGVAQIEEINVSMPDFFREIDLMLTDVDIDTWKTYFKWNIIRSSASYLSSDFVDCSFRFYGTELRGNETNRARWKRIQGVVEGSMSEVVGQLYVEEYFPATSKERMLKLVENIRLSLGQRIDSLKWMSDETKAKAYEKLAAINVKIGYPDKWRDYSQLEIKNDSFFENVMRVRKFDADYEMSQIDKPVDKSIWYMSPQTVNAYYNPLQNEIVFPAAILQPPFFYSDADDALNYGAIGVVIGHEITHGFDDKGCKYDKDGNLNDWWTPEDSRRFEERTQKLVDQFNGFEVADSLYANGSLSLGENIADLGGLNISFQAFKIANADTVNISGFTPKQRFFLSYSRIWANNVRDKEIIRLTKEDVHSLGRWRIMGPLRNMPEFYAAFDIHEGDFMYLPEDERAIIW